MSRQTIRAEARRQAKIDNTASKLAARVATRKAKGLSPLAKTPAANRRDVPAFNYGKTYAPNGKREVARRLAVAA
jgi:hypothetical protein